jgi:tripartite-type tricarboxylate transporter receptor subunit TctC
MKLLRREFFQLGASVAALPALPQTTMAQAYPTRPVRIVVPFGAGGTGPDILARLIGQWLSERLGQPFVIENRPGAGGNIGTEAVVRAAADGYTLVLLAVSHAINTTLYDKLKFNVTRDITPIATLINQPHVMLVNPSVPATTVPDFIAYAKANPGRINMASPGIGTGNHLAGELFQMMAGINMVHVPYRGAEPAMIDLLAGQVQILFLGPLASIEYIRGGKLRALAVTTSSRSEALPDIPTVAEFVSGYEANSWFGIGAPRNTPVEIIEKLNREISAALANPKMKTRLADLGAAVLVGSPADFGKLIGDETEKWGKVIRAANIKAG